MTLDEAIKHCEEVAKRCELHDYEHPDQLAYIEKFYDVKKCAAEHRQLAEWLRELKERREQPEIIRCKDCKWWGRKDISFKDGSSMIVCKKGRSADPEGFCHYAEVMANYD